MTLSHTEQTFNYFFCCFILKCEKTKTTWLFGSNVRRIDSENPFPSWTGYTLCIRLSNWAWTHSSETSRDWTGCTYRMIIFSKNSAVDMEIWWMEYFHRYHKSWQTVSATINSENLYLLLHEWQFWWTIFIQWRNWYKLNRLHLSNDCFKK